MPHLVLEVSRDLAATSSPDPLLQRLHAFVGNDPTVDLPALKSRVRVVDTYVVGPPTDHGEFIHVELALLEGRPDDALTRLGQGLVRELHAWVDRLPPRSAPASVSVELRAMQRATYWK